MSKNAELLKEFSDYCQEHPHERFWQALRNWSGNNFVLVSDNLYSQAATRDTFYSTKRNGLHDK